MKKVLALILMVLVVVNIFAACGAKTEQPEPAQAAAQPEQAQEQDSQEAVKQESKEPSPFPMSVKDAKGADVTIEKKPEKIVSLTLGTDEMLLKLVDKSRIKAVTYLSEDPGLSNIVEEVKDISVKLNAEVEKIISIQPDLIFVADWADDKVIKQLRDAKIAVYAYKTPNGVEDQKKTVMEIARLVGEEQKGQEVIQWMDERLNAIEEKVKTLPEDKKLTALSLDSFYSTYGKNTTFDDIADRAGLVNLASKQGVEGWLQITKEKVVEMNPDVIFLPSWSYQGFDAKKFAEDFRNDKSLAGVSAVKNNRVFTLSESHMTSVSHNIVLGVEDAAKAAYPDLFK